MALTPEQRALLGLVQDRGLTDEEIGELIGTGADDVRRRVRAAEAARRRTPLMLGVALAGLVLLAGVLAVAGVFEGDEQEVATPLVTEPAAGDQEVARIELSGAAGSGAEGSVTVGIGADNSPYLDLDLAGLDPAPGSGLYMLWVDIKGGRGLPLPDPVVVASDGSVQQRLPLPLELAGLLEVGRALEVVLTDRKTLERVSRDVTRAGAQSRQGELDPTTLPRRPGEAVLRGRISA